MKLPAFRPGPLATVTLLLGLVAACSQTNRSPGEADAGPQAAARDSTVSAEELRRAPDAPIEQVLAGRIAGVTVMRSADGGIIVRIRGGSSIRGGDAPLYVIDGMPIEPGPDGSLSGINVYDIESIRVLKDPAETTMYGVRGANGVILIKMKRPGR